MYYCYSLVSEPTSKCHIVPSPIPSISLKLGRSRPSRSVCLAAVCGIAGPVVRWDMGCAAAGYLREFLMSLLIHSLPLSTAHRLSAIHILTH